MSTPETEYVLTVTQSSGLDSCSGWVGGLLFCSCPYGLFDGSVLVLIVTPTYGRAGAFYESYGGYLLSIILFVVCSASLPTWCGYGIISMVFPYKQVKQLDLWAIWLNQLGAAKSKQITDPMNGPISRLIICQYPVLRLVPRVPRPWLGGGRDYPPLYASSQAHHTCLTVKSNSRI